MPKGYWIANNQINDPEIYERYKAANGPIFQKYGASFVVRGGEQQEAEGTPYGRTVVIEFPSYADALACYESPEYQQAKAIRSPISEGNLVIVQGV